jgi:hypothetical protein
MVSRVLNREIMPVLILMPTGEELSGTSIRWDGKGHTAYPLSSLLLRVVPSGSMREGGRGIKGDSIEWTRGREDEDIRSLYSFIRVSPSVVDGMCKILQREASSEAEANPITS